MSPRYNRPRILSGMVFSILLALSQSAVHGDLPTFSLPDVTNETETRTEFRDLTELRFHGLSTFDEGKIEAALLTTPKVFAALHPAVAESAYRYAVQQALLDGFHSRGFCEATVDVNHVGNPVTLNVNKGPRYGWGPLVVEGIAAEQAKSIQQRLMSIDLRESDDKDPKQIWKSQRYPSSLTFNLLTFRSNIEQGLTQIGYEPADCEVTVAIDSDAKLLTANVRVPADLHWSPNSDETSPTDTTDDATVASKELPYPGDTSSMATTLREIYRKNFSAPFVGYRLTTGLASEDSVNIAPHTVEIHKDYVFLDAALPDHSAGLQIFANESAISIKTYPANRVWDIHFPWGQFVLTRSAASESENNKTWTLKTVGTTSSEPQQRGQLNMSPLAFAETLIPGVTSSRSEDGLVEYTCDTSLMMVDSNGHVVELRTIGAKGRPEVWTRLPDHAGVRTRRSFKKDTDPRRPIIGSALVDWVRRGQPNDTDESETEEDDNFFVPPNGEDQMLAHAVVVFACNAFQFEPDSQVGKLVGIYAAIQSNETAGVRQRLEELAPAIRENAVVATAAGYLAGLAGWDSRSKQYSLAAMSLLGKPDQSLEQELQWLLDELPGSEIALTDFDVHSLALLARDFACFADGPSKALLQAAPTVFPEPSTDQQRVAQSRQALQIVWDKTARSFLLNLATAQAAKANKRLDRIARKTEKKRESKASANDDEIQTKSIRSRIR